MACHFRFLLPLPEPDDQGRRVILGRQSTKVPDSEYMLNMLKVNLLFIEYLLCNDDRSVVYGTVSVMDHSGTTMAHMKHFSPSLVKKVTTIFQVC